MDSLSKTREETPKESLDHLKLKVAELEWENARLRAEHVAIRMANGYIKTVLPYRHLYDLFMQVPAAIVVLEGRNHIVRLANLLTRQILGGEQDIIGLPLQKVTPEAEKQGFITLLDQVYQTGKPYIGKEVPTQQTLPDGTVKEATFNLIYLPWRDDYGKVAGVMAFAIEVTTQKEEAETLCHELQKALHSQKELDYLKDLFISIAGHELRTPLTTIKGYTQLVERAIVKDTSAAPEGQNRRERQDKILRSTQNILHQINRMNELVNQLLDFSHIQNQQLELHSTEADLVNLLKQIVEQQSLTHDTHKFKFQIQEEQLWATFDPTRLEQVLDNLIGNALKYSPPDTTITVGVEYTLTPNNSTEIVIWVQDEGYGIQEEAQAHIFERFYRIRTNETKRVNGLGLGLYVSHEIVKAHKGRMWLNSKPGKGSTFYVALPFTPCQLP